MILPVTVEMRHIALKCGDPRLHCIPPRMTERKTTKYDREKKGVGLEDDREKGCSFEDDGVGINGLIKRGEGSCPSLFCVRIFQTGPHKIDLKQQQFYHIRSFREKL